MTKGRVTLDILCRDHPRENRHYSILQMPLFLIGDVRYTDLVFEALPTRLEKLSLIRIGMLGATEKQWNRMSSTLLPPSCQITLVQATGPSSSRRSDGADPTLAALAASIQVYLLIPAVELIDALQVNELSELSECQNAGKSRTGPSKRYQTNMMDY